MTQGRGLLGWFFACMFAVMLTMLFFAYEQYATGLHLGNFVAPKSTKLVAATTSSRGVILTEDAGLALVDVTEDSVKESIGLEPQVHGYAANQSSVEPMAEVALMAPVQLPDADAIPAIEVIDPAMEPKVETESNANSLVSLVRKLQDETTGRPNLRETRSLSQANYAGRWPTAPALARLLDQLEVVLSNAEAAKANTVHGDIAVWQQTVRDRLVELWSLEELNSDSSKQCLASLMDLARQGQKLGDHCLDLKVSQATLRTAFALERRVRIWSTVLSSLSQSTNLLVGFKRSQIDHDQLLRASQAVRERIKSTPDSNGWTSYLLIDEIEQLSKQRQAEAKVTESVARRFLSRVTWQRLTPQQSEFLASKEIAELREQLHPWALQPVDYRKMLVDIELLEDDPINRCRTTLAETLQTLRFARQSELAGVASAMNDYYRNANLRVAVSGELVKRMLPENQWQYRPVRQNILGADTRGDSQVKTDLEIKLIPDDSAWHVKLGVIGNIHSKTRSVKGPATLFNRQESEVRTAREIRLSPMGLDIKREDAQVAMRDQFRGMQTSLDGLPLLEDFMHAIVKDQYDQQKGEARAISQRIIKNQVDNEFDTQLDKQIQDSQKRVEERFLLPMNRLHLQPLVVDMQTTEERLSIRYRVAGQTQLAAHTPRPRAPTDSLLSMQLHQSVFNNTVAQLGLGDKNYTLVELCNRLATTFGESQWAGQDEMPEDVVIRFAPARPISLEFEDGLVWITFRIAELHQENGVHLERFIVRTAYRPTIDGLVAGLVHEGPMSIEGQRLSIRERLPIRLIFTKLFTSRKVIQLTPPAFSSDKRVADLAVSQFEIRDGWIAVAVSKQSNVALRESDSTQRH